MRKEFNELYFRNEHKLILPEDKGEDNGRMAATVQANFASIGFPLNSEDLKTLSGASREDIVAFYQEYFPLMQQAIDAGHDHRPFYPNFPEEVMEKSRSEIFIDQVIYGLSGLTIEPSVYEEAKTRFPFIGDGVTHVVSAGSEEDFLQSVQRTIDSAVAYSPAQIEMIDTFIRLAGHSDRYIGDGSSMKNRENRVVLAAILEDAGKPINMFSKFLDNPNDALRYAAVRSAQKDGLDGGDKLKAYSYASLRFNGENAPSFKLTSRQRGTFVRLLAADADRLGAKKTAEYMLNNKALWKKALRGTHIDAEADRKYKGVSGIQEAVKAVRMIRNNEHIDRHASRMEEALKVNDFDAVMKEAGRAPGDFARRFDKILRMGVENGRENEVIDMFRKIGEKSGIAAITAMEASIKSRTTPETIRYFRNPKSDKIWKTEDKNREPFSQNLVDKIHDAYREVQKARYAGKDPMGRVYVSPDAADVSIPADVRNLNEATTTYPRGTKLNLHTEGDTIRLFSWWTNQAPDQATGRSEDGRVDNDFSVMLYNEKGKFLGETGWDASYHLPGAIYSGDKQNGGPVNGPGVSEYIDIDKKSAADAGVAYIVPHLGSYTGQLFSEQPHTAVGYMIRNPEEFGDLYEPKTVETKVEINADSTGYVPFAYDVKNDQMVIVERAIDGRIASGVKKELSDLFMELYTHPVQNLNELVRDNAEANGELVENPLFADILVITPKEFQALQERNPDVDFSQKQIVFPYDMSYIAGYLMKDGADIEKKNTQVKEHPIDLKKLHDDLSERPDKKEQQMDRPQGTLNPHTLDWTLNDEVQKAVMGQVALDHSEDLESCGSDWDQEEYNYEYDPDDLEY